MNKKRVLVKITGEAFSKNNVFNGNFVRDLARQIKQLSATHYFAFVTGAGNIFRGSQHGKELSLQSTAAHQIGMTATIINGLILQDIFKQEGIKCDLLSAIPNSQLDAANNSNIEKSISNDQCIIFVAGTGNPFFSTDTAAILRGLQIKAEEVWKATNVNGIFDKDPNKYNDAKMIEKLTFADALNKRLGVMDLAAYALSEQHQLPIKIFNVLSENALIKAANETSFGSLIY